MAGQALPSGMLGWCSSEPLLVPFRFSAILLRVRRSGWNAHSGVGKEGVKGEMDDRQQN
jgi:hypothetical protein